MFYIPGAQDYDGSECRTEEEGRRVHTEPRENRLVGAAVGMRVCVCVCIHNHPDPVTKIINIGICYHRLWMSVDNDRVHSQMMKGDH